MHKRPITIISTVLIVIAAINLAFIIKTRINQSINARKFRINTDLKNLQINPVGFSEDDYAKVTKIVLRVGYLSSFSDLEILRKFKNLEILGLDYIQFKEKKLTKREKLLGDLGFIKIDKSRLFDISPIGSLTKLHTLSLVELSFRNSEVLKNLTNLKELNLSRSNISDLEPLKTLKNLQTLKIQDCKNITDEQVEDLQKALPNLKIIR